MKESVVQKLAAYSTIKGMADSDQYKNQYYVLAEFIKFIIVHHNLRSFSIIQMSELLSADFEFDVPYSVIKSSLSRIDGLSRTGDYYTVKIRQDVREDFAELNKNAEEDGSELIERLHEYAITEKPEEREGLNTEQLEVDFISYILDRKDAQDLKYGDLISKFCLWAEKDTILRQKIDKVREGSVLYCGLCYNIIETGSVSDEITLYLDTEVMFYLAGYDGTLSKKIASDFFEQVRKANANGRKISLAYFTEVKDEVNRYFAAAESIVAGKGGTITSRAMQSIVNGCETESDVIDKQSDFYHLMEYSYGVHLDENSDAYYKTANYKFNLESLDDCNGDDTKVEEAMRFISHINVLRKGQEYDDYMKSKHVIITETRKLIELSDANKRGRAGAALPIGSITNILWMKLGAAFGQEVFPANASIAVKARMALDRSIATNVNRTYAQTVSQFKDDRLTEEQAAARILGLQKKMVAPENISETNVDDLLDFSPEALQKYEDAYRSGQIELAKKNKAISRLKTIQQEKDDKLYHLEKSNYEKDQTIEKQKEIIQSYQDREKQAQKTKNNRWQVLRKILILVTFFLGVIVITKVIGLISADSIIGIILQYTAKFIGVYGGICTLFPKANIVSLIAKDIPEQKKKEEKPVNESSIVILAVADLLLAVILFFILK